MLCEEKRRKEEGNGQREGIYGIKTILAQASGTVGQSTDFTEGKGGDFSLPRNNRGVQCHLQ